MLDSSFVLDRRPGSHTLAHMRALLGLLLAGTVMFGCSSVSEEDVIEASDDELRTTSCARTPSAASCQLNAVTLRSFVGTQFPRSPLNDACVLFVRDVKTNR